MAPPTIARRAPGPGPIPGSTCGRWPGVGTRSSTRAASSTGRSTGRRTTPSRVNGFSGYYPRRYLGDVEALEVFPAPPALARAADLGVRFVVLHLGEEQSFAAYDDAEAEAILEGLPVGATASRYGSAWLVDLTGLR